MKIRINLYGDEFRPRRQWGTLPQMVLAWGLCLLVLVVAQLTLQHLQSRQRADNQQQELTLNALRSEGERLLAELGAQGGTILAAIEVFDFELALSELRQARQSPGGAPAEA